MMMNKHSNINVLETQTKGNKEDNEKEEVIQQK